MSGIEKNGWTNKCPEEAGPAVFDWSWQWTHPWGGAGGGMMGRGVCLCGGEMTGRNLPQWAAEWLVCG